MSTRTPAPEWLRPPADVSSLVSELWPATATKDAGGMLHIGGASLAAIAAEFGTPVYVLDELDFRSRAAAFRNAFDAFDVSYAGKAFLCGQVARWVVEEGLGLDVCSGGELALALASGVPAERMTFHGNNKSVAELTRALDAGVGRVVVDSLLELDRLSALGERRQRVADILIRVTPGVRTRTHQHVATAHDDQKFGLSIANGAAFEAAARAVRSPALRLHGLHSHVGSQIFGSAGFERAARRALELHARIAADLGVQLRELNLGGGFGIAYTTKDRPRGPQSLADGLRRAVAAHCRRLQVPVPRLGVEPGRAVVGPAMVTLYQVGTVKPVGLAGGGSRLYVSVDGGMSDNPRPALYNADLSCTLANRRGDARAALVRVVGKHCEAGDLLVNHEYLPADVRPGDLLAIPGTGAYCRAMASNYNLVPRPPVVAVRDGVARLVVRRETEEDLLRLDPVAGQQISPRVHASHRLP